MMEKLEKAPGFLWPPAVLALIDQLTKAIIRRAPVGAALFDTPLVRLTRVENGGIAFSLLSGRPGAALAASCLALVACALLALRMGLHRSLLGRTGLSLALGGALGNLIDRLLRGTVTDFIRLVPVRFPVFNVADCFVTLGVILLMLAALRIPDGPTEGKEDGR